MKNVTLMVTILIGIFLLSGCGQGLSQDAVFNNAKEMVSAAKSGIVEIDYNDFKEKLEKNALRIVIDIREPAEVENGFINQPNADDEIPYPETFTVNIPRGLIEFKIADKEYWDEELWVEMPDKDEEIVLYCKKGGRAALATLALKNLGYKNVKSLKGGYRIWLDPNAPLEEAPKSGGGCG